MSVCEDERTLTWMIENYSFCDKRGEEPLCMPNILLSNSDGHALWTIVLDFKGNNGDFEYRFTLSLLRYKQEPGEKKYHINIDLCRADNKVILELDESKAIIHDKGHFIFYVFVNVMQSKELEERVRKSPGDILIIRCRVRPESSPNVRNRKTSSIFAKTKIVLDKFSFNVNVLFGRSSEDSLNIFRFFANSYLFEVVIKCPEDDVLIEIKRVNQEDRCTKVKCQIFLLDDSDADILSSCDFFFFDRDSSGKTIWQFPSFFKKSYLVDRNITDRFTLRFVFFISDFTKVEAYMENTEDLHHRTSVKASENATIDSLQNDLNAMCLSKKHSDVKLRVGKDILNGHKLILTSRSPVFSAMFDQDMIESQTGEIDISDISADIMKVFLKFLYTGMLDELDCEKMLELLLAAEKYQVPSLKEKCSEILTFQLDTDNICEVASAADMLGNSILKTTCINYIKERSAEVLGSPKWPAWIEKNVKLGSEILCKLSENIKNAKA